MYSLLSVASALLALPPASAQLNELAQKAGKLYFGTATDTAYIQNPTYRSILTNTSDFGQVVPSNGQKWQFIEPEQGVFNFTEGHIVTDLARSNGQILRCHNLVWHSQLAPWVEEATWSKENLTAMLINHVTQEATEWKGQCYAWDVLNEALNEDGTYRESVFYNVLGEDYINIAFETAAKADPEAKLYYNDYNIESPGPKADGAARIVKLVQDAGIKIDGVGLQSHFIAGSSPTIDEQISTMEQYVALGVDVAITELDVRIELPVNDTNLEQQRSDYKASVGACMQVERCVGITIWDFYDPYSWVPGVFEGFGAATLWYEDFTKHPAYYGVVEALTNTTSYPTSPATSKSKRSQVFHA